MIITSGVERGITLQLSERYTFPFGVWDDYKQNDKNLERRKSDRQSILD